MRLITLGRLREAKSVMVLRSLHRPGYSFVRKDEACLAALRSEDHLEVSEVPLGLTAKRKAL
jgi:hypothetical protein